MPELSSKTIVIKIGTSTLVDESGKVDRAYLTDLASQVSRIREMGWKPVIVTSAAISCGLEALGIDERPEDMPSLQASASVGQSILSASYAAAFADFGILTSSVLLTRNDTASRTVYLHARDTLLRLLELNVVPIVNENDTVSVEQIRFGDNDTLSALVACLIKADLAVIFSDIEGLFDKNPSTSSDARLISQVDAITEEILSVAGGPGSKSGSGGMKTKITAARVLMVAGIPLVICNGRKEDILVRIAKGESVGTRFSADRKPHEITPRKLWIALGDCVKGALVVDDGAKAALESHGGSLLLVGVVGVEGDFDIDDIVDIMDSRGHTLARGKVSASSDEVRLAHGRSQRELRANRVLAALADRPLVHRDELVVFE